LFEGAKAKRNSDATPIGSAGVQVAHRIQINRGRIDCLRRRCGIKPGANQRRYIQPQRSVADTADAKNRVETRLPALLPGAFGPGDLA